MTRSLSLIALCVLCGCNQKQTAPYSRSSVIQDTVIPDTQEPVPWTHWATNHGIVHEPAMHDTDHESCAILMEWPPPDQMDTNTGWRCTYDLRASDGRKVAVMIFQWSSNFPNYFAIQGDSFTKRTNTLRNGYFFGNRSPEPGFRMMPQP